VTRYRGCSGMGSILSPPPGRSSFLISSTTQSSCERTALSLAAAFRGKARTEPLVNARPSERSVRHAGRGAGAGSSAIDVRQRGQGQRDAQKRSCSNAVLESAQVHSAESQPSRQRQRMDEFLHRCVRSIEDRPTKNFVYLVPPAALGKPPPNFNSRRARQPNSKQ